MAQNLLSNSLKINSDDKNLLAIKRSLTSLRVTEAQHLEIMTKIKIDFAEKSIAEKLATATNVIIKMSANDMFMPYQHEINEAADAVDMLSEAYLNSLSGSPAYRALMPRREKELTEKMSVLAFYVQVLSKGNENIIRTAGFEVIEEVMTDMERIDLQKQLAEIGIMRIQ